jgi:hypothetical protein
MKVISAPSLKEWAVRAECQCLTKVEVDGTDLRHSVQQGDSHGESSLDLFFWVCPTCDRQVYLTPPEHIKVLVMRKYPGPGTGSMWER